MLFADEESFPAVGGVQDDVAVAPKDTPRDSTHLVVVLHKQDRLCAANRVGRGSIRHANLGVAAHPREVDLERGSLARLAVDPDVATALLDDPEDHSES